MSDNNQFQPYRYSQNQDASSGHNDTQGLNLSASRYLPQDEGMGRFFKAPLFLLGAGLFAMVFLTVILVNAFTGGAGTNDADVPMIQAENTPARISPAETNTYAFPNSDSSIYETARNTETLQSSPMTSETNAQTSQPSRLELLAMQAEREAKQGVNNGTTQTTSNMVEAADSEIAKQTATINAAKAQPIIVTSAPVTIETSAPMTTKAPTSVTASTAASNVTAPKTYSAGSSPETLAFVKSVLDKKDQAKTTTVAKASTASTKTATALAKVKPAAGKDRSNIIAIKPGSHYVQLASVKTQAGAHSEWGKLKGKYNPLTRSDYRVTRADLGKKGVFFRIQAGPMSKSSASDVCDAIKQSSGSCFVTQ